MKIGSQKDFLSGLMFSGVGIAFAWGASGYSLGTGARMGPGYFPLMLGVILALLGMLITFLRCGPARTTVSRWAASPGNRWSA